jgi:septum formation protein
MPLQRKNSHPGLILASASAQRRKLLKLAGLPFVVKPSQVEEKHQIQTTCAALVKHNALLKARDVASRFKTGIVIGADTVVTDGKKTLIGKPKDLKHAREILKDLFSSPHWVYTGLALIDVEKKKTLVEVEKTKIFMNPLTEAEITHYHKKTTPLDKAGGFDIEGRGGLFIHRIEGCYSNVIGLPLARLRLMLKEFGVEIFL